MFNLILAIDQNNLVGSTEAKFGMPWHYPEDLKFYKEKTTGQNCVMGRSTYEAIGKALPNRQTFVLTTNTEYVLDDATVINDISQINADGDWWICGGVNVFKQFWNCADTIYITRIGAEHQGDVYFNDLDLSAFTLVEAKTGNDPKLIFEKWMKNEN
ncbi:dihydrofolate reductase [Mollicutes bacterium LVI A0039]|nr:dihydrofolate reductase [Mollicutes bacterium LVI A0039]